MCESSLFFFRFLRPPRWRFSPPKKPLMSSSPPFVAQSASVFLGAGRGVVGSVSRDFITSALALEFAWILFGSADFGFCFCAESWGLLVGWKRKEAINRRRYPAQP